MSQVELIKHQGRDIIKADLAHIAEEQVIVDALDEVQRIIEQRDEPFCTLYVITGSFVTPPVTKRAKELSNYVDTTGLSRGSATVGVDSPTKRIIGNFLKPSMYFAKDMDDALAYLTDPKRWSA